MAPTGLPGSAIRTDTGGHGAGPRGGAISEGAERAGTAQREARRLAALVDVARQRNLLGKRAPTNRASSPRKGRLVSAERTRIPVGLGKFVDDETTRLVLSTLAAFLVSQVLAGLIHGFILATDYGPYYGTLLRSMDSDTWQVLLLPVSHLSFICGLMWVYTHVEIEGSAARKGVLLGCLAWIMGQVPLWLIGMPNSRGLAHSSSHNSDSNSSRRS